VVPGLRGADGTMAETFLDNGVRVLSERIPGVRSAAVGVWVLHGAAHDPEPVAGASHLLEHMVFKGTKTRSARDIALSLEGVGGSLDAYTSREHTGFQARVLDQHLPLALDVLADLVRDPLLREEDLELEREVVLEEIAEVEDTPDDLVFELHGQSLWEGHPYGRPILGSPETVGAMPVTSLRELHAGAYVGRRLIVAGAGNLGHDTFLGEVARLFADLAPGAPPEPVTPPGPPRSGDERHERDSAQTHLVFGTALPAHADPSRYGLILLSSALGGGMSSRLFQRVREELGLCYSVYTYQSFYRGAGVGGIYVGTRPGAEQRAVAAVREELAHAAAEGLPPGELEQAKRQVKGQVMLTLESTSARLHRLVSFALNDEPFLGLDDLLARLDAVTDDEVAGLAERFFHPDRHLLLRLGPA
jgi:predicted Zn-dependent peptidase